MTRSRVLTISKFLLPACAMVTSQACLPIPPRIPNFAKLESYEYGREGQLPLIPAA